MVLSSPRGRCVGSSLAATAAEDDRVKVDSGNESLLSSAPPPPPRQKIRGQKRAAEALDCLRRCDGGWRRRWLAVAAGGVAMALSAGGDKKGGQLWSISVFVTHELHGGKNYTNFRQRYGIAPRVRYAVASRKILIPLSRALCRSVEKNTDSLVKGMILFDQGGGGRGGGKGHGRKCSPPSVPGPLVSVVVRFF
jgi:hypothetical protein